MDTSSLTAPKFWYGRRSRRDLLRLAAIGLGAAGTAGVLLPLTQTMANASGTFSPVPLDHPGQSGYAWVGNHGLDGDSYQREFDSLGGQGYRLIKLSGYSVNGQDYYASIWDMSPGPAWVGMHRVPGADYQAQFESLTSHGFRPVDISGYEMNGSDHYAAIFEQSDIGGWSAAHGVRGADYQAVFDQNVAAGLRPLRVSGFTAGGADYIASIWVGDDGTPWAAMHGLDATGYQAEFDRWTGEGLRVVDISGYEFNGTPMYTAVFDGSTKPYWISHHNMSAAAYQAAFTENGASGYTLTHVAGFGAGGEARYAAIWVAESDPTGGTVGRSEVDTLATNALAASGAPGLTVAIAKDGMLVYAKAYGTADASTGEPLTLQHRMRVASVSKPITAAAVLQLAESGVLTLDDKVFGFDSWLGETYGTMSYTSDILEITIDHLLNHQAGGWGGNTMFQNPDFSMDEIITWHLDTIPLTNAPGTMFTYSNFGYCLLGRIIEVATGQSYESYLQGTVLAQCGVSDMQIAGDSLAERAANEVVYDEREFGLGRPYEIPVRRMDAHGGWIATATDLLRFMVRMDDLPDPADVVTGASLGDIGWGGAGRSWGHTGQLAGTEAVISRQADGICYAVIANGNGLNPDTLGREMAYAVTDWGSGTPL